MKPDSSALILHHYATSPFSEKIRKLLAHKRVSYFAVEQPNIMPKPDLVPLTGGYRRIPVLQIGADVYCDSQLIARVLERAHPSPTIYPNGSEATCHAWNMWADRLLFMPAVAVVFADIGEFVPKEFIEDRTKMMPGRNFADVPSLPRRRASICARWSRRSTRSSPTGARTCSAATSVSRTPPASTRSGSSALRRRPACCSLRFAHVQAWLARVDALGNGDMRPLASADALAIARDSAPAAGTVDLGEPNDLAMGDAVTVTPDDYGFDPVAGTIAAASADEIAVRRRDPSLGDLVVHFPRIGFRVARA
jgi:glutathione S-transferase